MICPKCKKELPEDSLFCSGCGYSFKSEEEIAIKKNKNKKLVKIGIIAIVIMVVAIVGGLFINKQIQLNKVVEGFKVLVDDDNYKDALIYYEDNGIDSAFVKKADAYIENRYEEMIADSDVDKKVSLFNSGLLNDQYVSNIQENALSEMEQLQNDFISEKIAIDNVKATCDIYVKYKNSDISSKAKSVYEYCQKLDNSRSAYKEGIELADSRKYESALQSLNNVISEDSNFDSAQKKIEEIVPLYKTEVMSSVDKSVASNKYDAAIKSLESLLKYCSDSDVSSKLTSVKNQKKKYDDEQEQIKIEGYKNNQQVEVTSTRVYDDGYYITLMRAEVKIKNNSNKTAKEVSFGLLLFDGNGYPVDVEWTMYQGTHSNEFNCAFNSCNVTAGSTYGGNKYYDVPDNCRKAKACVRSVTYTDGSTWSNPYYEYWLKDNYNSY